MRKTICLLLCAALFAAATAGCAADMDEREYVNPIDFYYCEPENAHGGETGALAYETVELGSEEVSVEHILELYFAGPATDALTAPFPSGLRCEQLWLEDGILTLQLSGEYAALSGVWLSLTNACLTETLLQLPFVSGVRFEGSGKMLSDQTAETFTEGSFLLEDTSMLHPEQTLTLYFPDAESGALRAERQSVRYEAKSELPRLALQALFSAEDAFPEGTSCEELSVQGSFCTVLLSGEFLSCDTDAQTAQLSVRAVVATLCALDEIDSVQLSVSGGEMTNVDLSAPLMPEEEWFQ